MNTSRKLAPLPFSYVSRLFVPHAWALDVKELGHPPIGASFELIREGARPRRWPGNSICFDFLFFDGSASCIDWLSELKQEEVFHPVVFLLHEHSRPPATWKPMALPRLACDFNTPSSWLPLLHAPHQVMGGLLMGTSYGHVMRIFPQTSARIELVRLHADSCKELQERVCHWLQQGPGPAASSAIFIVSTPTFAQANALAELMEPFFAETDVEFQVAACAAHTGPSLVLVLRYANEQD